MINKKKLVRNLMIIIFCLFFMGNLDSLSFTPMTAFKKSERSSNYGPSKIIKTENAYGKIIYLCKYDKWYSVSIVSRALGILCYKTNCLGGVKNNTDEAITYWWNGGTADKNNNFIVFFGMINNKEIKSVSIQLELNGKTKKLEQKKFYDNMYMFIWKQSKEHRYKINNVKGYDKNHVLISKRIIEY